MLVRFCLYSILKNLRFFDKFFIIYLLAPVETGGAALSFFQTGLLAGYQALLTAILEVPSGVIADRWGRRRSLAATFTCYAIAFPLFGLSARVDDPGRVGLLVAALTLFGIGEAFRTGTHKAIMLDWVETTLPPGSASRVIGVTRFWSKMTAGVSALVGGLLVWLTGSFTWLFWGATLPAVLGVALMLSYPSRLEGAGTPGSAPTSGTWRERLRVFVALPGLGFLFLQSVLFESQVKAAQHYLQPFLQFQLEAREIAVVGGIGALLIGLYYLIQEGLGGWASWLAAPVERRLGGADRMLRLIPLVAALAMGVVALSVSRSGLVVGAVGFTTLIVLQNLRRPVFVARFDQLMDKRRRATTLSVESQARSVAYAVLAPVTGWIVDHYGLSWAFVLIGALLLLASTRKP